MLERFRSVIASANRAQVSVYSVDAGGLRTQSGNRESYDEVMAYARQRERQEASGTFGSGGDGRIHGVTALAKNIQRRHRGRRM